ncbi:probable cytochrome P450 313a2 isoform X2 [Aethina tumida]|nr:probable cytochrome P450 313a2 isoform X2 [Aethina tumida]
MSKPYQWWNFVFYNTQTGKSFKNMITYARSIFNEMIYAKKKLKTFVTEGDNVSKYSKPTLDLLLENENDKMTQQHIIDEIVLLLAASSDTIAWTITLTCYMLGMYPDIQENVYNEILRNTDFSEPIDSTTLPKLGYTKMVVKEVLRLFPLGPIVARKTTSDINLGSRVILKGMDFAVSIFNVHRSKKYWKDPLKFDPNRFTPEQVKQRHPYTYIPFSAGPRNCIGWKYAMNVVVYTVAELVRNFNLVSEYVPIENIDFDCLIILKTVENVVVQFQERTM